MTHAKNFILKDQNGVSFELYKNLQKNILLVFYPKDNSPVCSRQLKEYSDFREEFEKSEIKLVAINNSSPEEHTLFCESKQLNLVLLSDPDLNVIRQFRALYPFNIVKRKLVLVGTNSEIVFEKNLPPFLYWNYEKIIGFLSQKQVI